MSTESESDVARERRLRYELSREGLALRKSRVRSPNLDDFGRYQVVDPYSQYLVAGPYYELTLDDVEEMVQSLAQR